MINIVIENNIDFQKNSIIASDETEGLLTNNLKVGKEGEIRFRWYSIFLSIISFTGGKTRWDSAYMGIIHISTSCEF